MPQNKVTNLSRNIYTGWLYKKYLYGAVESELDRHRLAKM